MLSVLPKNTSLLCSLDSELSKFISFTYATDPDKYKASFEKIKNLRETLRTGGVFGSAQYLSIISRYICCLDQLEEKFEFSKEKSVKLKFKWYDSITEESSSQSSISFERANVYFNLAACLSCIAAKVDAKKESQIKESTHFFALAANIFDFLSTSFVNPPFFDLSPNYLIVAKAFMLCQAHECSIFMAKLANSSPKTLSRLCQQAATMWNELVNTIEKSSRYRELLGSDGKRFAQAKECFYQLAAHYNRSLVCKDEKNWGEQVARLRLADALLIQLKAKKILDSCIFHVEELQFFHKNLGNMLQEAEKLNSLVYMQEVPKILQPIPGFSVISEKSFESFIKEQASGFPDLFPGLSNCKEANARKEVQQEQQNACKEYKNKLLAMKEQARIFNSFTEKSYDALLGKQFSLPNRLKNDATVYKKTDLTSLISELESKKAYTTMQYNQAISLVETDNHEFNNYIAKFSSSFTQIPTAVKGAHLISSLNLLKGSIQQAENSICTQILEPFKQHQQLIQNLCLSEDSLQASFASTCFSIAKTEDSIKEGAKMRELIANAERILNEYQSSIDSLKDQAFPQEIHLNAHTPIDLAAWKHSMLELEAQYNALRKEFTQSMEAAESHTKGNSIREAAYTAYNAAFLASEKIHAEGQALKHSLDELFALASRLLDEVKEFYAFRSQERTQFSSFAMHEQHRKF